MGLFNNKVVGVIRIIFAICLANIVIHIIKNLIKYPLGYWPDIHYEGFVRDCVFSILALILGVYNFIEGYLELNMQNLKFPKLRLLIIIIESILLMGGMIMSWFIFALGLYGLLIALIYLLPLILIIATDFKLYKNRNLKTNI